ncbi:protein draper-like [Saccostrea cucullata]|uniref:protein draper-like n=1 Tax=Saccostrea cuccullata TaxID=36930 RepID=UPI002ED453F0
MAELENYIVIFGICAAILQGSSENICGPRKPDGKLKCCTFYHYNGSDCIECPHGYFGVHCNISCAYPTYGSRCKHNCTCKEEDCDNALGCSLTSRFLAQNYNIWFKLSGRTRH